jgi:hypothetical protein
MSARYTSGSIASRLDATLVTCGDEEEHQDDGGERRQWNCERRRLKET